MSRARGYTLVELLTALVIAAVLAAIGLPWYREQVLRVHRRAVEAVLVEIATRQEAYFTEHKEYARALSGWYLVDAEGYAWFESDGSSGTPVRAAYKVRFASVSDSLFTLEAVPVNAQARDAACGTLRYDNLGGRFASGTTVAADCWR